MTQAQPAIAKRKRGAKKSQPRFSREQAEVRRAMLIEAATRCLSRGGIGAFTIDSICKEANVSRGLINHYFDGRDGPLVDRRFKGSIIISPTDPRGAAAEIRRLGTHKDIVQVLASHGSQRPYGDPFYHPIFEACAEVGLPFAIHFGGQGGVNHNAVASGPTTYYWETHALLSQPAMTHVVSMISNGVFEKCPDLYLVVIECGVSWVPSLM